ncbi:MAG: dienelactone hydrolase family protein [Bryobacteraceae bacterium]
MAIQTEFVNIAVADGTTMRGYLAKPEGSPRAAIIVYQEIFGVNSHIRDVTERFAKEGYLALAPELFHRSAPGFDVGYTEADMGPAFAQMGAMTQEGIEADVKASVAWLRENAKGLKIAATGYCMGGRTACLSAILEPLACAISYYGGGIHPNQFNPGIMERLKGLQAPVLFFWAGKDHFIPAKDVEAINAELRANGKTFVATEFSDSDHGFFCDQRGSYNASSAVVAWPMTLAFLADKTK